MAKTVTRDVYLIPEDLYQHMVALAFALRIDHPLAPTLGVELLAKLKARSAELGVIRNAEVFTA